MQRPWAGVRPMKLDDIRQGTEALLYMERYVDEATRTYSRFAAKSEVSPAYQPRADRLSFDAVTVRVPIDRVSVCEAEPEEHLRRHYIRPGEVRFVAHPETWSSPRTEVQFLDQLHALPQGEPARVAPTASTRTVLA